VKTVAYLSGILALFLMTGCGLLDNNDDNYITGEVVASVEDHVTESFVIEFTRLKKIGIRDVYFPSTYLVRVGVEAGDIDEHVAVLSAFDIVESLNVWGDHEIRLNVVVTATEEEVRSIISNRSGLSFNRAIRFQNLVVFEVAPGSEDRWVRKLSRETWVKHAERNQTAVTR